MRAAVISDVHGNLLALQAVLADIRDVDLIIANGDLLAYGPRPAETLELLRSLPNVTFISGNNDRYLLERRWQQRPRDGWEAEALANLRWTAEDLGQEGLNEIERWPFQVRPPLSAPVTVVHASPVADNVGMFPWTSDAQLQEQLRDVADGVVVCGHTHLLMDRQVGARRIVSDGSAGFPFDRDIRPSCVILDDSASLHVEVRRVAYDVERAIVDLEQRAVPFAQVIAYQMRHASLMPKHETDYARRDLLRYAE
ncbi:MAG: metallophosphoesterase family protein [Chloroflexota bacterium]|nr:metallophosphoesterase family protein [Chloroflexota bacterium]